MMVAVVVRGAGDVLGEMRTGGGKRRGFRPLGFIQARAWAVGWGMGLPPSRGEKWGFGARSLEGFARGVSGLSWGMVMGWIGASGVAAV